jgi:2-polyprenyl-3-methyl-5-hydroxy-6-metoxy-1,4-benzoquinol methylase
MGHEQPNPVLIFETLNSYQRSAALKAAIQLNVFTAIGEGNQTPASLAKKCQITERGARILSDYLTILGFLTKADGTYTLTRDAAVFLDRRSPACIASISNFMTMPESINLFMDLAETLRSGGATLQDKAVTDPENPIWVEFARSMMPLMLLPANAIAKMLCAESAEKWKVLDIAAGHGIFGITIAQQNPHAEIFGLDSANVLAVAKKNADSAGVASRYHLLPGSAFDVDLGSGYDLILLTNFLHHFDIAMNESLLHKVHGALAPEGRTVTLEFVPNEDRVTPPAAASFSMIMLGQTVAGDAYTFAEYQRMFRNAGFSSSELRPIPGPESVIISHR